VKKDPRVTLYYYEPAGPGYVTLQGRAAVVTDPAEKAKRWKEDWAAFYKDRNRGEDYVLIRVAPVRLEIVSYGHGLLNDPASWRPSPSSSSSRRRAGGAPHPPGSRPRHADRRLARAPRRGRIQTLLAGEERAPRLLS